MSQDYVKEETIDGHVFQVYMLPPKVSLSILTELGKMLGPALGKIADSEGDRIGEALGLLIENIDNPKLSVIMDKMAEKTMVDGKALKGANFDSLFMGKIGLMFKWLIFALRSQYADFLGDLTTVLGGQGLASLIAPQSKSQNT